MNIKLLTAVTLLLSAPVHAAESTSPADEPAAAPEALTESTGSVARATFTSNVTEREPVDAISTLSNNNQQIYYFTEILDLPGGSVKHRWEYNGELMAEIPFTIGGPRWRVYSSKTLDPQWLGEWKVSTIDASGSVLSVNTFTYMEGTTPANSSPAAPEAEAPAAPQ